MTRLPIRDELRQMRDEMNQMIDEVFNTASRTTGRRSQTGYRRPVMDLTETNDEYHVTAELPGVNKEDINITVQNNALTLHVDHEETTTEDEDDHVARKRRKRSFHREMTLPDDADTDDAHASYSNGILELRLPKTDTDDINTIEIR